MRTPSTGKSKKPAMFTPVRFSVGNTNEAQQIAKTHIFPQCPEFGTVPKPKDSPNAALKGFVEPLEGLVILAQECVNCCAVIGIKEIGRNIRDLSHFCQHSSGFSMPSDGAADESPRTS